MNSRSIAVGSIASIVCLVWLAGCSANPIAPRCDRRTGTLLSVQDQAVAKDAPVSFEVTSPENSNLTISVMWIDRDADVKVVATIIDCGVHVGCQSGQPVTAQASQTTFRELRVDGSRGKRYRIDLSSGRDVAVSLRVTYDTGICT